MGGSCREVKRGDRISKVLQEVKFWDRNQNGTM
jgi:hypothetical protein